jgi:MoaA/NifB/PqqE/SkfB family radical SAM enzyme
MLGLFRVSLNRFLTRVSFNANTRDLNTFQHRPLHFVFESIDPMRAFNYLSLLTRRKIPGQLVIQLTDKCNAHCPQCGMRVTEKYQRAKLPFDDVKRILDVAAQNGVQAVSFTGGEPFLLFDELSCLMKYAGQLGITLIRTGTNGFFFRNSNNSNFKSRIKAIAEKLAETPVRNFWISIDSAVPEIHEKMRGFPGVLSGIEKSLHIFHEFGIYPSANLGINRNMAFNMGAMSPSRFKNEKDSIGEVYRNYKTAFEIFFRFVIRMGFTMINMCYPMSIDSEKTRSGLNPVYAATSPSDIVRFSSTEKVLLFTTLLQTVLDFRSSIRIFTPLSTLHSLTAQMMDGPAAGYPCRGGIDFFFINARDGNTYPCGYRGNENFGKYWEVDWDKVRSSRDCRMCDWECFRDPSELFGPILQSLSTPLELIKKMRNDPQYLRLWWDDLKYYRACDFFNGRHAPDYNRLNKF